MGRDIMPPMRFSYAETFCDPTFLAPLARAAEDAGYDSFVVPDSVIFPAESDTPYPYTDDGDRAFLEDKPIIEPFTLVPFLAAQTTRLRFTTFVLKLAIRPAVLVAKQAASIAVMSGDRLRLGVGISPWPEDFAAMQLPWERRGLRMDETVDVVRGLTAVAGSNTTVRYCRSTGARSARYPRSPFRSSSAVTPTPRSGAPPGRATAGSMPEVTAWSWRGCSRVCTTSAPSTAASGTRSRST